MHLASARLLLLRPEAPESVSSWGRTGPGSSLGNGVKMSSCHDVYFGMVMREERLTGCGQEGSHTKSNLMEPDLALS